MRQGNQFQSVFCFFSLYQVKASDLQLDFTKFRQPSNQHTIETNCLKFYTIDPEICSILIFQIRVWERFLQHILCMIFQQKCSSCYIFNLRNFIVWLLYFLRYWTKYAGAQLSLFRGGCFSQNLGQVCYCTICLI